ncbi:MAG: ribosomal RNA small subunit methyltransferase A [Deltaproteobacteria bacterium]|nr:ribosomal RNA small subunit methyltransferase A [Deltaproteobacteria bacterium]
MDNFRADKSWGQNYLINRGVIKKIIDSLELKQSDTVIEIGAGKGALTSPLVETGASIIAIEPHEQSREYLREKFSENKNLKIIDADATIFDFRTINSPCVKIVGNLPYNVSSRILKRLFVTAIHSPLWVLMFQKEMAYRIAAIPGNSEYGSLSVMTEFFTERKILFNVKAGSFSPPPKIESSVMSFIPNSKYRISDIDGFEVVLKKIFSQRRKKMETILKKIFPEVYRDEVLSETGFSFSRRPQEFLPDEFFILISAILKYTGSD